MPRHEKYEAIIKINQATRSMPISSSYKYVRISAKSKNKQVQLIKPIAGTRDIKYLVRFKIFLNASIDSPLNKLLYPHFIPLQSHPHLIYKKNNLQIKPNKGTKKSQGQKNLLNQDN